MASLRLEIFVADLDRTSAFYTGVLGFDVALDRRPGDAYVAFRRGDVRIGAAAPSAPDDPRYRRPPTGVEIVVEVADVAAEVARWRQAGADPEDGVQLRPWGLRDARILDPDGYYLRFTDRFAQAVTFPPPAGTTVGEMTEADWPEVRAVYEEGIAGRQATFETVVPGRTEWDAAHLRRPRLVARARSGAVVGWAALSPVSGRCVYGGVAEVSVYVAAHARGRGVGRALLSALVEAGAAEGLWTLQAGVLAENTASLALHAACGFREVGVRERLGQLDGVWRDVVLLERRLPSAD